MNLRLAWPARTALLTLFAAFGFIPSVVSGQDLRFRDGRFLETMGGVMIQRADEAGADEAVRNMPFLPGDRVWTDDSGRAEILFSSGEILWISGRAKVDSLGREGREEEERLGLRLFAGSFGARVHRGGPGFEFRAPGGSLTTTGPAAFRLDVRGGETVISVREGEVLLDFAGERTTARSGQRIHYRDGRVEGPFTLTRADSDEFDDWCDERGAELDRYAMDSDRLPDELDEYGYELAQNGEWVYEEPAGYVYVPRVASDWAPYTYGRWVYTLYGWTWIADEPWGFVTSHYGRWGYSSRIGWHWMPRTGFSGAWVGWSSPVGAWGNTIGWSALGFDDRPIGRLGYRSGGRAVSRDDSRRAGRGWTFVNRSDMGRAGARHRRIDLPVEAIERAMVWNADTAPDRSFREDRRGSSGRGGSAPGAVRRGDRPSGGASGAAMINVRPSPGDSTPELRSDPTTTIPSPESRRQRTIGQDGFKDEQNNRRSRARPGGAIFSSGESASPDATAAAPRPSPESGSAGNADPAEASRSRNTPEGAMRDPLLSRFFRSLTRPNAAGSRRAIDSGEGGDPQSGSGESKALSRDPSSRDAGAESIRTPRRTRPQDADRERARPVDRDRSQPRATPAPRTTPNPGASDDRGARRRPRQDQ